MDGWKFAGRSRGHMGVHVHFVAEAKFCFVSAGSIADIQ